MTFPHGKAFPGFKHVCLMGMQHLPTYRAISAGIVRFRGQSHKWLIHDLGWKNVNFPALERGDIECDIVIGRIENQGEAEALKRLGKPVLDLLGVVDEPAWKTHSFDFQALGKMAGEYLLGKGFHHFGFNIHGMGPHESAMWKGFREAIQGQAHTLLVNDRFSRKMTYIHPREEFVDVEKYYHWFPQMPRPFAMLAHADEAAAVLAELAFFAGVSVPEELALLGWGNHEPTCMLSHPHLSSIAVPCEKLGFMIGEHAHHLLEGEAAPTLQKLAPQRVVTRRSTDLIAVEDPLVAKALGIMNREAATRIPISAIVAQLPISKRSFNQRFMNVVGRTPRDELFRIRLGLVRERLINTDHTILHIALDTGFADAESMVRMFKKAFGLTPSAFRKQNLT